MQNAVIRIIDLLLSTMLVIILLPFLLLIIIGILLIQGAPIFFIQSRVGRGGRLFKIIKFRTMHSDSEAEGKLTLGSEDNRITKTGMILRKAKIDELPQLLNVIAGHMSLVGYRPEVPEYVEQFKNEYKVLIQKRPGITGLASLKYYNEASRLKSEEDPVAYYLNTIMPAKIAIDRDYVENYSVGRYLSILWKTITRFMAGEKRSSR